jgi:hypothetical protein
MLRYGSRGPSSEVALHLALRQTCITSRDSQLPSLEAHLHYNSECHAQHSECLQVMISPSSSFKGDFQNRTLESMRLSTLLKHWQVSILNILGSIATQASFKLLLHTAHHFQHALQSTVACSSSCSHTPLGVTATHVQRCMTSDETAYIPTVKLSVVYEAASGACALFCTLGTAS